MLASAARAAVTAGDDMERNLATFFRKRLRDRRDVPKQGTLEKGNSLYADRVGFYTKVASEFLGPIEIAGVSIGPTTTPSRNPLVIHRKLQYMTLHNTTAARTMTPNITSPQIIAILTVSYAFCCSRWIKSLVARTKQ